MTEDELLSSVDKVLDAMSDLQNLRDRLAAIDDERAQIESQIAKRLIEIRAAADGRGVNVPQLILSTSTSALSIKLPTTGERILSVINADPSRDFSAMDLADIWGVEDSAVINRFRAALSRLNADGRVMKTGYGRYRALRSARSGNAPAA